MSVTLTNQSNIEMKTVKDLVEGDVIIHTEVNGKSVDVRAYLVTDTSQRNTHGLSTGIKYRNVGLEVLKISASSKMGHFTQNGLDESKTYMMNEADPVAVVVNV